VYLAIINEAKNTIREFRALNVSCNVIGQSVYQRNTVICILGRNCRIARIMMMREYR